MRSNNDLTAILSVSGTTLGSAVSSPVQLNAYGKGVKLVINTIAATAGSFTVTIQGIFNQTAYTALVSAAISATGVTVLTVYPGLTASANVAANDVLPRQWQVTVTPTGFTGQLSIGACVIV